MDARKRLTVIRGDSIVEARRIYGSARPGQGTQHTSRKSPVMAVFMVTIGEKRETALFTYRRAS